MHLRYKSFRAITAGRHAEDPFECRDERRRRLVSERLRNTLRSTPFKNEARRCEHQKTQAPLSEAHTGFPHDKSREIPFAHADIVRPLSDGPAKRGMFHNCIIQKFSYGKSRPYVHSSGISIRVQSLNLIQLSTFSRTRILKSHTLNKRNTDKDGIWNLSGLNIQNVRTAIHLFRTLVQNLHTFIHFSRTQIQNFHSSILKFHSPILKPRFRIQKSRLPVLSLRTRILNFRTRAVENGWHAAVASVQSFRHAIRRSRTAASDFRRRIGRAFRKVVDSKGNLKDEEIRSYDRSFATSHER